jgi:hypothetical protein
MSYAWHSWEFAADICLLKLHRLKNGSRQDWQIFIDAHRRFHGDLSF